jgi:hypothetical protein
MPSACRGRTAFALVRSPLTAETGSKAQYRMERNYPGACWGPQYCDRLPPAITLLSRSAP